MLASDPVPTLNQKKADLGIPRDSLNHPALGRRYLRPFSGFWVPALLLMSKWRAKIEVHFLQSAGRAGLSELGL
jgi:hypothetical protein